MVRGMQALRFYPQHCKKEIKGGSGRKKKENKRSLGVGGIGSQEEEGCCEQAVSYINL